MNKLLNNVNLLDSKDFNVFYYFICFIIGLVEMILYSMNKLIFFNYVDKRIVGELMSMLYLRYFVRFLVF